MNKNFIYTFIFIIFSLSLSPLNSSPLHFLDPLPDWINIFEILTPSKGAAEVKEELTPPKPTSQSAHKTGSRFTRIVRRDKRSRIVEVELQDDKGVKRGSLQVTWDRQHNPLNFLLLNAQGEAELSHSFEYDQQGQIKRHTKTFDGVQFTEECRYINGTLRTVYDSRGRIIQFVGPEKNGLRMTVTTASEGHTFRSLWQENTEGQVVWSAVDDGSSLDPENLTGVTQRTWKRVSYGKKEIHTEEGYTIVPSGQGKQAQERLVRKTVVSDQGDAKIYDAAGTLLYQTSTSQSQIPTSTSPALPQNVQKTINGLGQVDALGDEKIQYNLFGFPSTIESKDGGRVEISTTTRGDIETLKRADGGIIHCRFSVDGLPLSISKEKQKLVESKFDSLGRPTKVLAYPENASSPEEIQINYSTFHKTGAIYSTGKRVNWTYDPIGRISRIQEQTPQGTATWEFSYDAIDRVIAIKQQKNSPGNQIETLEVTRLFDLQSRPIKEEILFCQNSSKHSCTKVWSYNKENTLLTATTDDTIYTALINAQGEVIEEKLQQASIPNSAIDNFNSKTEPRETLLCLKHAYIKAQNGHVHMTQRQDGVRRKRITSPDGKKIEEFYFDANQQLVREVIKEKRDERGSSEIIERSFGEFPMSRRIVWTIGPDRRLHTFGVGAIDEPIARTTFSYTKEGLLKRKELPDGVSIEYTYDSSDRLIEVESSDKTIHYSIAYDSLGRISTTRDLIHGKVVERGFNSEGVLSFEKEDDLALLFTRATDTTPEYIDICSQAQIFYTDSIVATCGKAFKQFDTPPKKPLSSGTAIDPLLQPGELIENDIRYSFDSLGQLQREEKLGGGQQEETKAQLLASQSFSSIGTLTKKDGLTVEHDTQGRPTKIGGKKYTYDARGNLARIQATEQDAEHEILLTYDALDRLMEVSRGKTKERYRYDYFARKREAVKFSEDTDGHIEKIRYLWLGHEEIGSVDGQSVLQDFKILDMRRDSTPAMVGFFKGGAFYETKTNLQGTPTDILGVSTLQYTAFGTPLFQEGTVSAPWGFMGKREIKAIHAWDFGGRVYLPETCSFISQDPFWLFGTGASPYALLQNRPVKQVEIFGLFSWPETFGDFLSYLWKGVETVFWKSYESITFAKKQLDWFYEYRSHFEDLAFRLVSKSFLNLIGYNPDRSSYGTFGARELASNVRITEINGILNAFEDIFEHIQVISDCHGGMPVHYIYSATDGFTGDLLRSALAKVGFISPQARYLAATWRKLIQEMGGTSGGGVILHYAHSLGGTDTQAALSLMTQQERKMIKVNTFGAATLVADSSCNSVMNYVSIADGVPITCIAGYVQALLGWREDVCFLESKSPLPLIDHLFLGESYRRVIEELGRQFQEEYIKNTN